jgi:hypothetical protein
MLLTAAVCSTGLAFGLGLGWFNRPIPPAFSDFDIARLREIPAGLSAKMAKHEPIFFIRLQNSKSSLTRLDFNDAADTPQ